MNLPATRSRLEINEPQLILQDGESRDGIKVTLNSEAEGVDIRDAAHLVVRGEGYASFDEAERAGSAWRSRLIAAFASVGIGVDLGTRAPTSTFTEKGLDLVGKQMGVGRALNDVHGTMIFECDPPAKFLSTSIQAIVGKPGSPFVDSLRNLAECLVTERQETSFDLFSASFFVDNADARFTLLMMALETLIDQDKRSEAVRDHVRGLIELTRDSSLPAEEVSSMIGALSWLFRESIGQAGRRLVQSLTSKEYNGMTAVDFFDDCYQTRSALVHGETPRPSRNEVDARAASLETLVSDLLTSSIKCG